VSSRLLPTGSHFLKTKQKQGTVRANVSLLLSPGFIRDIHHTLSLKQKQEMSPVSH
jgi:hypothetical protein